MPYAKAADTIYLVMAKRLRLPFVTRDGPVLKKAQAAGINAIDLAKAYATIAADG